MDHSERNVSVIGHRQDLGECVLGTHVGKFIDIINPNPDLIEIEDIATGLSRAARFGGQSQEPYYVAEHSVCVALYVRDQGGDPNTMLAALLHDAAEAYMGDMPSPIKQFIPQFCEIEDRLKDAIMSRFGVVSSNVDWSLVKEGDVASFCAEAALHMPQCEFNINCELYNKAVMMTPMLQNQAKHFFLDWYDELRVL